MMVFSHHTKIRHINISDSAICNTLHYRNKSELFLLFIECSTGSSNCLTCSTSDGITYTCDSCKPGYYTNAAGCSGKQLYIDSCSVYADCVMLISTCTAGTVKGSDGICYGKEMSEIFIQTAPLLMDCSFAYQAVMYMCIYIYISSTACPASCTACTVDGDGVTTCTTCESRFALNNGACEGKSASLLVPIKI